MSLSSLRKYLAKNSIQYRLISYSPVSTAQGLAVVVQVPGRELAKTVMVKADGELAMPVLPSASQVDIKANRHEAGVKLAELATEDEVRDRFPGCETGAMPPFGNLYGMRVFVDERLSSDKEITFNAGSHHVLIRMAWNDFERLAEPTVIRHAARRRAAAA